jgi:hypothetical protein
LKNNVISLEILGNGGPYSLNYERITPQGMVLRAGFASWSIRGFDESDFFTFPLTLSFLTNPQGRGWEVGGGFLLGQEKEHIDAWFDEGSDTETTSIVDLIAILGYRWRNASGWVFRFAVTPFLTLSGEYPDETFMPSVGILLGRAF